MASIDMSLKNSVIRKNLSGLDIKPAPVSIQNIIPYLAFAFLSIKLLQELKILKKSR